MFTNDQLANSPSRICGVDPCAELSYRQQAACLISDMGQKLDLYAPFLCRLETARGTCRLLGGPFKIGQMDL